jgi:hypothetical protein
MNFLLCLLFSSVTAIVMPAILGCTANTTSLTADCAVNDQLSFRVLAPTEVFNGTLDTSIELGVAVSQFAGATIDNTTRTLSVAEQLSHVCFGGHTAVRRMFIACATFALANVTMSESLTARIVWLSATDQWNGPLSFRFTRPLNIQSDVLCFSLPDLQVPGELPGGVYCLPLLSTARPQAQLVFDRYDDFIWLSVGGESLCILSSRNMVLACGTPLVDPANSTQSTRVRRT